MELSAHSADEALYRSHFTAYLLAVRHCINSRVRRVNGFTPQPLNHGVVWRSKSRLTSDAPVLYPDRVPMTKFRMDYSFMKRLLRFDWDVLAGIIAAVVALVLHLLHIAEVEVVLAIVLAILALLLVRDLRSEGRAERLAETVERTKAAVDEVQLSLKLPEAILIGPRLLRSESERFAQAACGEMIWFNVCFLMFKPQELFDVLLRPAIENPRVTSIQFISNEDERELWEQDVLPKIKKCFGCDKVREPRWSNLPETVSFIIADTDLKGSTEALLSFWGEPFMAKSTERNVPRYIFWVQSHSDLVSRLVEVARQTRMEG